MNGIYTDLVNPVLVTENILPNSHQMLNRRPTWSPTLYDMINAFGPLPDETLLMGQGEDGKAIMLNLHESAIGPLLIKGDSGTGKTNFLLSITKFVDISYKTEEMQYCVITPYAEEWQELLSANNNCLGVFASREANASRLIRSLKAWLHKGRNSRQIVLLLVDGFEHTSKWDSETQLCMHEVMTHGTAQKIWTIATMNSNVPVASLWLRLFGVHLIACPLNTDRHSPLIAPFVGPRFAVYEQNRWVRFWVPSL